MSTEGTLGVQTHPELNMAAETKSSSSRPVESPARLDVDRLALIRRRDHFKVLVGRFGVLIAFFCTVAVFSALKPHEFLRYDNLRAILIAAAPLAVIAVGLTVVLTMKEFDLSFSAVAGLAAAVAATLMANDGVVWWLAVIAALLAGAAVGFVNSTIVAFAGVTSFIATLAVGTVATGVEYLISGKQTIYQGIPTSFVKIGQGQIAGIDTPVVIAAITLVLGYVLLERSKSGRRMRAVGGNVEAARLAGVRVRRLRSLGFVIVGVAAAGTGIIMSATAATYTPSIAAGLLLPAYAAVFLGSTLAGRFSILGTGLGIIFLGIVQNGLILLGLADAWINIVQGSILAFAVLLSRIGANGA